MKHCFICILLAITITWGCKKENTQPPPPPPDPPRTILILEKTSNKPISGATVHLQKCSKYDNIFGCVRYATFNTLTTNSRGEVTFSNKLGVDAVQIEHQNYWALWKDNPSNMINLTPKCPIRIAIKRVNTYSPGDVLVISIRDPECGSSWICVLPEQTMGLPIDTVAFIEGRGYSKNEVTWYTKSISNGSSHTLPEFYVNGFDTTKLDIQY